CSRCKHMKNPEEFFSHKLDKYLKTCNLCHKKLDLPSASTSDISVTNNNSREILLVRANNSDPNNLYNNEFTINIDDNLLNDVIEINNLEEYISTELEACENSENSTSGMEINLDINLLHEEFSQNKDTDLIFKRIIEAIQNADSYKWNFMYQYNGKTKQSRWYNCSLSSQRDRTTSNPKRLCIKQPYFESKNNVDKNIVTFIQNNVYLTSRQLWENLQYQSETLTQKQVHFWWTVFSRKLYYHNDNQFISATYLLEEDDEHLLLYNATYKTNSAEFELYVIIANIEGVGYPISYLFLNSPKNVPFTCTTALIKYLDSLQKQGVNPTFVFSDKDFAQIDAIKYIWPNTKIQLCWWHIRHAVLRRLRNQEYLTKTTYNPELARNIFSFISLEFKPTNSQYFCPIFLHNQVLTLMMKHFSYHSHIPIDAIGTFLTPSIIYENAILSIYNFCVTKNPISQSLEHFTDIQKWIYSCTSYLLSRFMICKHLVQAAGESNETDCFQKMVDDLKYLVADLEQEITKSNSHHLQAVQHNIQKTLKVSQDIRTYRNHISNIQM
ncbi:8172_t:CDS:2, partial [Gigaspora margarita]